MKIQGRVQCHLALGFFGRVDDLSDLELFNKIIHIRKKEVADEISLLTTKLNFGYEEARSIDIETRRIYIERIQELFGDKKQQGSDQPISEKEKALLSKNQERFGKGKKR